MVVIAYKGWVSLQLRLTRQGIFQELVGALSLAELEVKVTSVMATISSMQYFLQFKKLLLQRRKGERVYKRCST